jgi:hypothetical protein
MKSERDILPTVEKAQEALTQAAEAAGLQIVSDDALQAQFTGLNIYYFGSRESLQVMYLLFYWQD